MPLLEHYDCVSRQIKYDSPIISCKPASMGLKRVYISKLMTWVDIVEHYTSAKDNM